MSDAFGIGTPAAADDSTASDAFGLRTQTKRQATTAPTDHFGVGQDWGRRIQHPIDQFRDKLAGAAVKTGGAVMDFADQATRRLGEASLAPQRAVSTLASDAMSPKKVGTGQLLGDMGGSFMHPDRQPKIDNSLLTNWANVVDANPTLKRVLQSDPALGMLTQTRPEQATDWGSKARNLMRNVGAQTLTDPTLVSSKLDALYQGARLVHRLTQTKAAAQAGSFIRDVVAKLPPALNPIVDKELHDVATPPTVARMQGAASAHQTAESKRRQRQYEIVKRDAAEMDKTGQITPAVRHLLHEDAWLNGTQDVRDAVDKESAANAQSVFDETGEDHPSLANHLLDLHPELKDAPLLNRQTAFKEKYNPHTPIDEQLADFSDDAQRRVLSEDFGFNMRQQDHEPNTPLSERVMARLELGRNARADIGPIAAVLKELAEHQKGFVGQGLSDVLGKYEMRDLEAGPRINPNAWRYQDRPWDPAHAAANPRGGNFFHRDRNAVESYNDDSSMGGVLGGQHLVEAELHAKNPLLVKTQGSGIQTALNVLRPNKLGSRLLGDREFAAPRNEPWTPESSFVQAPDKMHDTERPNFDDIPDLVDHTYPKKTTDAPITNTGHLFKKPFQRAADFGEMGIVSPYAGQRGTRPQLKDFQTPAEPDVGFSGETDYAGYDEALRQYNEGLPRGLGDTFAQHIDTGESDLERQRLARYFKAAGMSAPEINKLFKHAPNDHSYVMKDKMAALLAKRAGHDVIHKESGESMVLDPSIVKTGVSKERIDKLTEKRAEQNDVRQWMSDRGDDLWTPRGKGTTPNSKPMVPKYVPIGYTEADVAKMVHEKVGAFQYHPLTDQEKYAAIKAMYRDLTRITVPAAIAAKLTTPKAYDEGTNWLKKLSDYQRTALFWIPFTHMKNIGTLQYEGPGGASALGRGTEIFADLERSPQKYASTIDQLQKAGAAPHFFERPTDKLDVNASKIDRLKNALQRGGEASYALSNKQLWNWDLAQRLALHEHLLAGGTEHVPKSLARNVEKTESVGWSLGGGYSKTTSSHPATYADLSPYEQGSIINSVLFDYHHKSPMAEALRAAGAPFPHWTIGNMTLQGKQFLKDPRRMAAISRTQNVINQSLFPPGTGYSLSANDPVSEASKTGSDLTSKFGARTLLNKGGPLIGGVADLLENKMDLQKLVLPENLKEVVQGLAGTLLPGGSTVPTALGAAGSFMPKGNPVSSVGDFLGADRFKSKGPALARALLGTLGMSMPNDPSPYAQGQRQLMDANWDMPVGWYQYHH